MVEYIIDSHAHLDDERFEEDRDRLIKSFEEDRVLATVNPAVDLKSSQMAVELANENERIFAMVGSHPDEIGYFNEETKNFYIKLARSNSKVVAVGEIGLDYHWDTWPREDQKRIFIEQIEMARDLNLPIVIHSRDAIEDTYEILEKHAIGMKVLLHAFSESWEVCQRYLKLGFYIALGGVVTFKNANKILRVAENIPLERLLLETDSPYLTPMPYRGKRNQPKYVHYVAKKIGELKNVDPDLVRKVTSENAKNFFGLKI